MNFNVQLTTPEGKDWEIDEHYKENGEVGVRQIPFTYLIIARESLIGSGNSFTGVFFTQWRYSVWEKIENNISDVKLTFFDRLLLKKLVCIKYDISIAARLIKYIK